MMASAAELTLHAIDFLQSAVEVEARASAARWVFMPPPTRWPGGPGYTFAEAAAHLDGLPKPVFIGALNHPGVVGVWPRSGMTAADEDYLQRLVMNQLAALEGMLSAHDSPGVSAILFDTGTDRIMVSLDDFKLWLQDYGLTWGWKLAPATDADHIARLLLLKDGRHWSPGATCGLPGAT
jgi:hypothetical protein